ncbi:unnamed protein product [Leuciscus chuanchicus]
MHYMDPNEPSLSFVRKVEMVREYSPRPNYPSRRCSTTGRVSRGQDCVTFMKYTVTSTSLHSKDKSLFSDCRDFIDPLDRIRAGMSKKVNKELTQKREESSLEPVKLFWRADERAIRLLHSDGTPTKSFSFDRVFSAQETTSRVFSRRL